MTKLQKNPDDVPAKPSYSFAGRLLRLFKSIKFAVILILIFSLLNILGAIIPQVPAEFAADPSGYSWWLENVAYYKFGFWTLILKALGLFNIFHSFLFLATSALLMLGIIICTLSRIQKLRPSFSMTDTAQDKCFYTQGDYTAELTRPSSTTESSNSSLVTILKKYHYRVKQNKNESSFYLTADKNKFSLIGTCLVHLSLILFVIGFILGSCLGFRNTSFIIAEESIKDVDYNTGLSLGLESFRDEYYNDGTPKDYRSKVVIFKNGEVVKHGTIRVNHPLTYNGIRFHQMFFGPAVKILVADSGNSILFNSNVALPSIRISRPLQRPEGNFKLEGTEYTIMIVGSALNGSDPLIGKDEIGIEIYKNTEVPVSWAKLKLGVSQKIEGLDFTFLEHKKYSGLQVSKEPGISLIWIASFLFLAGICMVFYFPQRKIWIAVFPVSAGKTQMLIKLNSSKRFSAETEFLRIITELNTVLNFKKEIK